MSRQKKWSPINESDLGELFIPWIEPSGWTVYQEVSNLGKRADLVLTRGNFLWVIEIKKSLSIDVMTQANHWIRYSNATSVLVPFTKITEVSNFSEKILKSFGIGLIRVGKGYGEDFPNIKEIVKPERRRYDVGGYWKLNEGHRVSGKAGNASSEYWSEFRQTCWNLWFFLSQHPGSTLDQITGSIHHHYKTTSSARQAMVAWVRKGVIEGVRIDEESRPFKFYLKEGFDWRAKAKLFT